MNYKNSTEKTSDGEISSVEDAKIRSLLGSLKRVDAPKDFDFRVKARIANAQPADYRTQSLPVLRYVLPLGLVILISAAVVFNNVYFGNVQNGVPVVVENKSPVQNLSNAALTGQIMEENIAGNAKDNVSDENVSNPDIVEQRGKNLSETGETELKSSVRKLKPNVSRRENSGGGSFESASGTQNIINPTGIIPDKTVSKLPNAENINSLTVGEVLSQLGIESVFTNGSWTVKSVRQNSPAERSGIKSGDAVEAIDGEKLTDKPLQNKTIDGKKITVARGAEKIEISLVNKLN